MISTRIAMIIASLIVAIALLTNRKFEPYTKKVGGRPIWLTFYSNRESEDNEYGQTGMKSKAISYNNRKYYPVAVHEKDFKNYVWKTLKVKGPNGKEWYGVVTDMCAKENKQCKKENKDSAFLIDIHEEAGGASAAGYPDADGIKKGASIEVGSRMKLEKIPSSSLKQWIICSCPSDAKNIDEDCKWVAASRRDKDCS